MAVSVQLQNVADCLELLKAVQCMQKGIHLETNKRVDNYKEGTRLKQNTKRRCPGIYVPDVPKATADVRSL